MHKNNLWTLAMVLAFFAGIFLMLYPTFSNWWNGIHQTQAIAAYQRQVDDTSQEELDRLWDQAEKFNEDLLLFPDRFDMTKEEKQAYEETLDVSGTGVMGYIEVKKQGIYLPIYHDSTEEILEIAVGHLAGTSLPAAGQSTHVVLTGHTGLPTRRLFTDIDKMEIGDEFQLLILGKVMTYQVVDIQVVLPNHLSGLTIEPGKQYCTLVTCTPYGVNTHRLLVRGKLVSIEEMKDDPDEPGIDLSDKAIMERKILMALPFIGAVAAFATTFVIRRKKVKLG